MEKFTEEEIKLMSIYSSGTRMGCYYKLEEMTKHCGKNKKDKALLQKTKIVMEKLLLITDEEFDTIDLYGWVEEWLKGG